jgi:hypothetical protein
VNVTDAGGTIAGGGCFGKIHVRLAITADKALTRVGRPLPGTPENIAWLEERAFGKVAKQRAALASSERVEFATGFLAAQFIENARSRADVSLRERGKKRAR